MREVAVGIQSACQGAGRTGSVELVAVSKTMPVERIQEVYDAGLKNFAENKVQEYLDKKDALPGDIAWHFIGRLQTNKVKPLIAAACRGQLALLQSLDRLELADEIEKQAAKAGLKKLACLIQVNSSGEAAKAGFEPQAVEGFLRSLRQDSVLDVRGLMAIGPHTENVEAIRQCFRTVRKLRHELREKFPGRSWDTLSMGMSADYKIAIAEGSTLVRVGTAIFGARV
ncbi:MAG: YggS family pyridoxal phosphate-dependent enzyme [Candidatus Omnitrophica bacterium]|nr:YggS family pyridoxal phosphate-dependent enzyme [Candidatus Omnitrophota bacterium]